MSYIRVSASSRSEITDLIAIMARKIDFTFYGKQKVESEKRGTTIHVVHEPSIILMLFEGFGDLFSRMAVLHHRGRSIANNLIGIDNEVTLNYKDTLPTSNIKLLVAKTTFIGSD